jgi:hypothetical protein
LRRLFDRLLFRPLRRSNAPAEIDELFFRNVAPKRPNCAVAFRRFGTLLIEQMRVSAKEFVWWWEWPCQRCLPIMQPSMNIIARRPSCSSSLKRYPLDVASA